MKKSVLTLACVTSLFAMAPLAKASDASYSPDVFNQVKSSASRAEVKAELKANPVVVAGDASAVLEVPAGGSDLTRAQVLARMGDRQDMQFGDASPMPTWLTPRQENRMLAER